MASEVNSVTFHFFIIFVIFSRASRTPSTIQCASAFAFQSLKLAQKDPPQLTVYINRTWLQNELVDFSQCWSKVSTSNIFSIDSKFGAAHDHRQFHRTRITLSAVFCSTSYFWLQVGIYEARADRKMASEVNSVHFWNFQNFVIFWRFLRNLQPLSAQAQTHSQTRDLCQKTRQYM